MSQPSANDVLMGGGGAPSAKFEDPGTTWEGRIVSPPQSHQVRTYDPKNPGGGDPKFYPSGDPIMGITVDIATSVRDNTIEDDDGVRRVYLDGRYVKDAVRDAVRTAGASGLEVGGHLKITFTHREDPADKRSRKFWDVTYTPAGNAALMGEQTAQQPTSTAQIPAPAATPASAAGPTAEDIATAKTLIEAGLDDATVLAAAASLNPTILAALRNASAA
jgi:hypothetical protein